jgi:hypothetical protein
MIIVINTPITTAGGWFWPGFSGHTVVYTGIVSVVLSPYGQFWMVGAHAVIVYVIVVKIVEVVQTSAGVVTGGGF